MTDEPLAEFKRNYLRALEGYLRDPTEAGLEAAYELGRDSVADGLSILDLVASHHAALARALSDCSRQEIEARADAAGTFLLESLSTFEMTQRGFQEAQEAARLEREHARALRGLADAAVSINAARGEAELIELAGDQGRRLIGAAYGQVILAPQENQPGFTADQQRAAPPSRGSLVKDARLFARALTGAGPTRLDRGELLDAAGATSVKDGSSPQNWLAVPLVSREGSRLGLIELTDKAEGNFSESDEAMLVQLAQMVSVLLENARLYEREHGIARTLQQSLLPDELPEIPGVKLAARYLPAGEGYEVGGDFFDVFDVGGRWLVVIGDVCGKGPEAAAITALVRYTARAVALHEHRPAEILAAVNEALGSQVSDCRFCTLACGVLFRESANVRLHLSLSGHPLPFVVRANGTVSEVGRPGTALGVVDDPQFEEEILELDPGDAVILYTDGLIEAGAPRRTRSISEFEPLLKSGSRLDPETIAESLETAAVNPGAPLRDDIAIVVLAVQQ